MCVTCTEADSFPLGVYVCCDLKHCMEDAGVSPHTLRHVQRSQHLLKDGSLYVGASQVRLLKVTSRQVAVLGETHDT